MSILSKAKKGIIDKPIFALIYAKSKVGKTTFGASAPDALFIDVENSSEYIPNVTRLSSEDVPDYDTFETLLTEIYETEVGSLNYKSIVVDSADRLELFIHERVSKDADVKAIEDIGWSKGYITALEYWRKVLSLLRLIQQKHKTHIIITGHALVKKFQDPQLNEAYDRFEIKLHHKAADLVKESVDMILFMRKDIAIKKEGKGQMAKTKAFDMEERCIYTQLDAAFDAGTRIPLPRKIVIPEHNGFDLFLSEVKKSKGFSAEDLYKQCIQAIKKVEDKVTAESMTNFVNDHKEDKSSLSAALERILKKTKTH